MESKTQTFKDKKENKKSGGMKQGAAMAGAGVAAAAAGAAGTAFAMGGRGEEPEVVENEPFAQQTEPAKPVDEKHEPAKADHKPAPGNDKPADDNHDEPAHDTPENENPQEENPADENPEDETTVEPEDDNGEYVIDENEEFAGIDDIDPDQVVEEIEVESVLTIDPNEEYAATEVEETIYTINGETHEAGTLVDEDGNEYVVVDINGDGIYDEYVSADGMSHDIDFTITEIETASVDDELAGYIPEVDTPVDDSIDTTIM